MVVGMRAALVSTDWTHNHVRPCRRESVDGVTPLLLTVSAGARLLGWRGMFLVPHMLNRLPGGSSTPVRPDPLFVFGLLGGQGRGNGLGGVTRAPRPIESQQHNINPLLEIVRVLRDFSQFLGDMVQDAARTRPGAESPFGKVLLTAQMGH